MEEVDGSGNVYRGSSLWEAGAGVGNPGGNNITNTNGSINTTPCGFNGTGGLLILYVNTLDNTGIISSNGTNHHDYHLATTGGASGAGSVNIFYEVLKQQGSIIAKGGVTTGGYEANGGAGRRWLDNVNTNTKLKYPNKCKNSLHIRK